jgi:hypothetical protein
MVYPEFMLYITLKDVSTREDESGAKSRITQCLRNNKLCIPISTSLKKNNLILITKRYFCPIKFTPLLLWINLAVNGFDNYL